MAHPTQSAYMIARALLDDAREEAARLAPMPGEGAPDEEVRGPLGLDRLEAGLERAEDAMLAWSFDFARRTSLAGGRAAAEIERGMGKYATVKNRAIDLALRLDAGGVTSRA